MNKISYFGVVLAIILVGFILGGINYYANRDKEALVVPPVPIKENPVQENPAETPAKPGQTGVANPASVYCVEQGGKLEIKEDEAGQYGVCTLPDGSQCDEWDFFRTKVCGAPKDGDAVAGNITCQRQNCHGLDVICGPNPPQICTEIYQLGDKCLQFAKCGIVDGVCQQIKDAQFDACKKCVDDCTAQNQNDPMKAFGCESICPVKNN